MQSIFESGLNSAGFLLCDADNKPLEHSQKIYSSSGQQLTKVEAGCSQIRIPDVQGRSLSFHLFAKGTFSKLAQEAISSLPYNTQMVRPTFSADSYQKIVLQTDQWLHVQNYELDY